MGPCTRPNKHCPFTIFQLLFPDFVRNSRVLANLDSTTLRSALDFRDGRGFARFKVIAHGNKNIRITNVSLRHSDSTDERCRHIVFPLCFGIFGFVLAMSTMNIAVRYISL